MPISKQKLKKENQNLTKRIAELERINKQRAKNTKQAKEVRAKLRPYLDKISIPNTAILDAAAKSAQATSTPKSAEQIAVIQKQIRELSTAIHRLEMIEKNRILANRREKARDKARQVERQEFIHLHEKSREKTTAELLEDLKDQLFYDAFPPRS
ncbi:hypothetical protein [Pseudovibrio sp. Ad26]|uniref:hypothetical protein n=1 Tax=Pseudovibrio sp. Ad26 TaxID=989410 RepID=UPI0007AE5A3F|nr:hypothetical protein [Pseudovibrio sp. Ad26]KZK99172.1 hypothetical protein PsAD26_04981 [Pseudovibrio sp. Ad26]